MSSVSILIAYEDILSGAVLKRVLSYFAQKFLILRELHQNGFGYLKKNTPNWNRVAKHIPVLMVTDLDKKNCPPSLIKEWLKDKKHPDFLFRIAVREVEAWLLADSENFASFLNISKAKIPLKPESNQDPKALLLSLVAKCPKRQLKSEMLPVKGGTAKQGPNYNECLIRFVQNHWDVKQAASNANSLKRMLHRLEQFSL